MRLPWGGHDPPPTEQRSRRQPHREPVGQPPAPNLLHRRPGPEPLAGDRHGIRHRALRQQLLLPENERHRNRPRSSSHARMLPRPPVTRSAHRDVSGVGPVPCPDRLVSVGPATSTSTDAAAPSVTGAVGRLVRSRVLCRRR